MIPKGPSTPIGYLPKARIAFVLYRYPVFGYFGPLGDLLPVDYRNHYYKANYRDYREPTPKKVWLEKPF